ncbi:MAG: glycosyltransferase family 87 protein [Chloroflexota bacterium]
MKQVSPDLRTTAIAAGLFVLVVLLMMLPSYQLLVKPRGQSFDLYSSWVGGRAVLAGQNPYGPEPTRLIQLGIYKQIIPPPEYQHGFALPAYVAFVLLPVMLLPFSWSILLWVSLQIPLLLATLMIGFDILDWQIGPAMLFPLAFLITVGFRYPLIAYVVGQVTIFVIFCLVLAAWLFKRRRPRWAAIALACATIRPDLSLAAIVSALVLVRKSPGRNSFVATLIGAGLVLVLLPVVFTGDFWPITWLTTIRAYGGSNPHNTWPPELLAFPWLRGALLIGLAFWLLGYVKRAWESPTSFNQGLLVSAAILVSLMALPQTGSYTLSLALIPALILLRYNKLGWQQILIAASLLSPWLYFWLNMNKAIFLFIPLQFVLLQELVSRMSQRTA